MLFVAAACVAGLALTQGCARGVRRSEDAPLKTPWLFATLPDSCPTPDGMAIDKDGTIILACPNYGSYAEGATAPSKPACFAKISKDNKVTKWVDCPVLAETKRACPMGIALGPDGDLFVCDNQNWPTGNGEKGEINQGRILRLKIQGDRVVKTTVVAEGMSHPNGVRVHKGRLYVTVSMLPRIKNDDGLLASAVYRFGLDDQNVKVTNTRADENLLIEYKTLNKHCQYGADGIVFDSKGNLYVGNFGDGALHKTTFNDDGSEKKTTIFAKTDHDYALDPKSPGFLAKATAARMRTTDGICIDEKDNIYVADFSNNAVCVVSPDGNVRVLARSPDCDGSCGGLDQPGEPIVRGNELITANFDMVTGPDKVNSGHDSPHTMSVIDLHGVR